MLSVRAISVAALSTLKRLANRIATGQSECRTVVVPFESRVVTVEIDGETVTVPFESHKVTVPKESRTVSVSC